MNALEKSPKVNTDNASILLKYENGSNVVLNYFSNGHKSFSKEKIEVFFDNKILILDNWRKLIGFGFKNFSQYKSKQNKGHEIQFKELINNASLPGKQLISFNSILNTSVASIKCIHSLRENEWVNV